MRFADKADITDAVQGGGRGGTGFGRGGSGGGAIKQRIARPGQGKSGGFRTLIVFRASTRAVFVHGFAKNERDKHRAGRTGRA